MIAKENDKNLRVDIFISKNENQISRSRIKKLILNKFLKLNKKILTDPSKKIKMGDVINLEVPEPEKSSLKPFDYKLDIIFEDDDLIILNKPAGIVMHPGAGNYDNTIVNALINYDKKISIEYW